MAEPYLLLKVANIDPLETYHRNNERFIAFSRAVYLLTGYIESSATNIGQVRYYSQVVC